MASLNCDMCDQPAAFLVGLVLTGDQTALCVPCFPAFAKAIQDSLAAAEAETTTTAPDGPDSPQEGIDEAWTADYPQPAPEGRRGRKRGQAADQAAETETAPTAADHE